MMTRGSGQSQETLLANPVPRTVALSGPDNVGKSTQIRILIRRMGAAAASPGALDQYDPRWANIKAGGMAAWWFGQASLEEVADVLACSYLERSRALASAPIRLLDRGIPMLEASLAATAAVRDNLDQFRAADRARALLAPLASDLQIAEAAEHAIVMLHDNDASAGSARSLAREPSVAPVYAEYQRHLHDQIHRLATDDRFDLTLVVGERSILAVQAELRDQLRQSHPAVPTCALADIRVVAFGGMSESGKSTAAECMRTRHGYGRLKIGYLIEQAASRCGIDDPYASRPAVQAELLTDSIDRYCAAHHFLTHVCIESLHRYDSTTELRKILGGHLTVLYVETTTRLRMERGAETPEEITKRDATKHRRGAAAISAMADVVIDNDGSRLALIRELDRLASGYRWPSRRVPTTTVNALGLPVHLESYLFALLDHVSKTSPPLIDLLAVTGSGARGKYQHGWSDLDVLLIAETACLPTMRRVLARLADELSGVKLGMTIVTRQECQAGAVSPRVLNVLRMIGNGDVVPLWWRPDVPLPAVDAMSEATASLNDGVQAAIEIRRQLLRQKPDTRALYKVAAMLAKVMLRFEGVDRPADSDALATLLQKDSENASDLLCRARQDQSAAEKLALAILNQWLATLAAGEVTA
jgi:hypothetical protein